MSDSSTGTMGIAEKLPSVQDGERFDIIVAGGGASGLMACVAAARRGAKVLVVESAGCFGGAATTSMVAQWLGFHNGETCAVGGLPIEYAARIAAQGGTIGFENYVLAEASAQPMHLKRMPFNPEVVKLVSDELVLDCGASALLHARLVGAAVTNRRITSVDIQTSGGRITVAGSRFIDATGDAVLARCAGAPLKGPESGRDRMGMSLVFRLSHVDIAKFRALPRAEKRAIALEGIASGELFWDVLSVSPVGSSDAICLMSHIDGLDALDANELTRAELIGRQQVSRIAGFLKRRMSGFERAELAGIASHVGVRESVRLEGDYLLTQDDVMGGHEFEDAIALGCGPLDVHEEGGRLRLFMPPAPFEIPARTMTTAAIENLVVTGRAISATRAANGAIRHQATAMALGQAAGHLAAHAADGLVRKVDISAVQGSLAATGAIPTRRHLPSTLAAE